ncbi:homeobox-leucine zipper protein HDG11 [Tanacetum coccineum]
MKDLSGTIPGTIHHKVIGDSGYGKDINVGAALILANVSVFSPKPSMHYLNIIMRNVVKVFRKDIVAESGSGVGLWECYCQEDLYKFDEEALNLALEEEVRQARAEQEWLEKSIFLYPLGAVEAACALEVDAMEALDLVEALKVEVEAVGALDLVEVEAVGTLDLMKEEAVEALDAVGLSLNILISASLSGYLTSLKQTTSSSPEKPSSLDT